MSGIPFDFGVRFLQDNMQYFVRSAAGPVALRVRNWQEEQSGIDSSYLEVGVAIVPSGNVVGQYAVTVPSFPYPPIVVAGYQFGASDVGWPVVIQYVNSFGHLVTISQNVPSNGLINVSNWSATSGVMYGAMPPEPAYADLELTEVASNPVGHQDVGVNPGYTDIVITPPPNVTDVSMHNIGILAGRLNFGSQIFNISHTWVLAQMAALGITDPQQVFRDRDGRKVIGIFYQNRLFDIVQLTHRDVAGKMVSWKIVGNSLEGQTVSGQ